LKLAGTILAYDYLESDPKATENKVARLKDSFITKKVSDYYFSRLIPDFFYHTPLANNYYPTIVAARVTISATFLVLFSWYVYRKNLSQDEENPKKYNFNFFTKRYIEYERELLLFEKSRKNKIIIG